MIVENFGFFAPGRETLARRFNEIFSWISALDAFDYGDRSPLSELIVTQDVPIELRAAISDIIADRRKPNLRAAAKLKIRASERMKIAGSISVILGLANKLKAASGDGVRVLDEVADRDGFEPIDGVRFLETEAKSAIEEAARDLDVSVETIENLLRDLRAMIANFPEV